MAVENEFSTVGKIVRAQVLIATLVASGFFMMGGWKYALSPMLGCGLALVPNGYLALKIYVARHRSPQGILNAFYSGEAVKFFLTAVLFSIVVQIPSVDFINLLIGYAAVLSVFWFALIFWRD